MKKLFNLVSVIMAAALVISPVSLFADEAVNYESAENTAEYSDVPASEEGYVQETEMISVTETAVYAGDQGNVSEANTETVYEPENPADNSDIAGTEVQSVENTTAASEESTETAETDESAATADESVNTEAVQVYSAENSTSDNAGSTAASDNTQTAQTESSTAVETVHLANLPVQIKGKIPEYISAGQVLAAEIEIKNITESTFENLTLKLTSSDSRYYITSFDKETDAQNWLWTQGSTSLTEQEIREQIKTRQIRIKTLYPFETIKVTVYIIADSDINIDQNGIKAYAQCELNALNCHYESHGEWKFATEITSTSQETEDDNSQDAEEQPETGKADDAAEDGSENAEEQQETEQVNAGTADSTAEDGSEDAEEQQEAEQGNTENADNTAEDSSEDSGEDEDTEEADPEIITDAAADGNTDTEAAVQENITDITEEGSEDTETLQKTEAGVPEAAADITEGSDENTADTAETDGADAQTADGTVTEDSENEKTEAMDTMNETSENIEITESEEDEIETFDVILSDEELAEESEYTEEYYDDWTYYYSDSYETQEVNTATPHILVKSYGHKKEVSSGDSFTLEITFLNTSQKLDIEGAIINVETSDGLSIANGTNTLFINNLAAGAESKQEINLLAANECKENVQEVKLSISYEYVDNKERKSGTSTENISIPVTQKARLELKTPQYDEMQAGSESVISVSYVNKGYSSLNNMEAVISIENADASASENYIGNVASGSSGSIDFLVTPQTDGDYSGTITLTYEDASQNEVAEVIPLEFHATAAYVEDTFDSGEYEETVVEETKEFNVVPVICIAGAVLVAAAVVFILIRRKKKAKSDISLDDEWIDQGK